MHIRLNWRTLLEYTTMLKLSVCHRHTNKRWWRWWCWALTTFCLFFVPRLMRTFKMVTYSVIQLMATPARTEKPFHQALVILVEVIEQMCVCLCVPNKCCCSSMSLSRHMVAMDINSFHVHSSRRHTSRLPQFHQQPHQGQLSFCFTWLTFCVFPHSLTCSPSSNREKKTNAPIEHQTGEAYEGYCKVLDWGSVTNTVYRSLVKCTPKSIEYCRQRATCRCIWNDSWNRTCVCASRTHTMHTFAS